MAPVEAEVGLHLHLPLLSLLLIDLLLVWWSSARTYKNAITNELFLLTSAEAYLRTRNGTYLENALKVSCSLVPIASTTVYLSDQEYQWCTSSTEWGFGINGHTLLQC